MGHACAFVPIEVAENVYRKNHRVHTVEDLWKIDIDTLASKPIRPVVDEYVSTWTVNDLPWDQYWARYSVARATEFAESSWMPTFKTWFDQLRFNLHVKLIQWKVLI